jgi:hypothetical protein
MIETIKQAARFYLGKGWHPVPVKKGEKKPEGSAWQELRIAESEVDAEFDDDGNIGLILDGSGDLVDCDLDCAETVAMADALLPPTPAQFGRASKPRSHRLYEVTDAATAAGALPRATFTDVEGKMMLEIRIGPGLQTVVPPSIHPSGEPVHWTADSDGPAAVLHADLLRGARLLAVAAILGRHWPKGGRHEASLAAAGLLAKSGVDVADAKRVLLAVVEHAGTPEHDWQTRAGSNVESTYEKLASKARVKAGPALAALLGTDGAAVVKKVREFLGVDATHREQAERDDAFERLNARFFVIDVATETVVGEEIARVDAEAGLRWTEFAFRSFGDFRNKLVKETVPACAMKGGQWVWSRKPLANEWLKSKRNGVQYNKLVYAPPGAPHPPGPGDLDGWRGFAVPPKAGGWPLTRKFIREIICDKDDAHEQFVLDFLASLFAFPGRRANTALVLTGGQGEGKNFFADQVVGRCFDARHARTVRNVNQALGDFNDVLSGVCWLVLDEVALTKAQAELAKSLVTADTVDINRKGIALDRERSMLHIAFLSNRRVPVPLDADDRRYAFLSVSPAAKNDSAYFRALSEELAAGGRAAMLHELIERGRRLDPDRLRLAPVSGAKRRARREGWSDATWFLFHEIREHAAEWPSKDGKDGAGERRVKKADFAARFSVYLEGANVRRESKDPKGELADAIRAAVAAVPDKKGKKGGFGYNRVVKIDGEGSRDFWTLPPLAEFKESFAAAAGIEARDFEDDVDEAVVEEE